MKRSIFRGLSRWKGILFLSVFGLIGYLISVLLIKSPLAAFMLQCGLPIFVLLLLLWLLFFSQFIVPLKRIFDRSQIFLRLLLFPTPMHGQAILIENGVVKQTAEELNRSGLGTAVLDTTSAALLETSVQLSRAIGPGVTFINLTEKLGTTVNLRPRKSFLGPKDGFQGSENPFEGKLADEKPEAYQERQKNRAETRAYTRDGIEVVPNIFIKFRLNAQPRSGYTELGYNPNAVIAALTSRDINTNASKDSPDRMIDWDWLPGKIATDVWRELAAFFKLEQLYKPVNQNGQTGISIINNVLRQRMTQETAPALIFSDNGTVVEGGRVPSSEYFLLLKRGIRVNVCTLLNLRFENSIENTLIQDWATTWLQRARAEREEKIQTRDQQVASAKIDGLKGFASTIGLAYINEPINTNAINPRALLKTLLRGSTNLFTNYPALYRIAPDELSTLNELQEWLQANQ